MQANPFRTAGSISLTALLCLGLAGCASPSSPKPAKRGPPTFSSFDAPSSSDAHMEFQSGGLNFQQADMGQVLQIYQEISQRTVIRPSALPAPAISLRNQTPLNRVQALQLLDTVLAQNGIVMVLSGDLAVKAVPVAQAPAASPPEISLPWQALPDSGSFMMRTVQLKTLRPSEVMRLLTVLASTIPNPVVPLDASGKLLLRDYASNIKRMLRLIEDLEGNQQAGSHSERDGASPPAKRGN